MTRRKYSNKRYKKMKRKIKRADVGWQHVLCQITEHEINTTFKPIKKEAQK